MRVISSVAAQARPHGPPRKAPRLSSDDDPHEPSHRTPAPSAPVGDVTAVLLAAGRGKRMQPSLTKVSKVLYPLAGRAIASHVLYAAAEAGIRKAVVVIAAGEPGDDVRKKLIEDAPAGLDLRFAVQEEPAGTGNAMLAARPAVETEQVLVINGDLALISPNDVARLIAPSHLAASVAVGTVDDPAKMGRIVRVADGRFDAIVEWRDASEAQRRIREVNAGFYRFRADWLWRELESSAGGPGEHHGTDVVAVAARDGQLDAVEIDLPDGRLNVEDLADAARAEAILRRRITERHLRAGVRIRDLAAIWVDAVACIQPGAIIEPGVHLRGRTSIGANSRIGPNAVLEEVSTGRECVLESCTIRDSRLGDRVEVGPYSTIRPGCTLADDVHIGSHAEIKAATLGCAAQVGHFSYIGDAELGERVNFGAGAVTCNFDGDAKHLTVIGEDAFIGSDTMLVAPVRIGARARTGAGSVVTKDVPDDGVAVGHPARLAPSRRKRGESA